MLYNYSIGYNKKNDLLTLARILKCNLTYTTSQDRMNLFHDFVVKKLPDILLKKFRFPKTSGLKSNIFSGKYKNAFLNTFFYKGLILLAQDITNTKSDLTYIGTIFPYIELDTVFSNREAINFYIKVISVKDDAIRSGFLPVIEVVLKHDGDISNPELLKISDSFTKYKMELEDHFNTYIHQLLRAILSLSAYDNEITQFNQQIRYLVRIDDQRNHINRLIHDFPGIHNHVCSTYFPHQYDDHGIFIGAGYNDFQKRNIRELKNKLFVFHIYTEILKNKLHFPSDDSIDLKIKQLRNSN